jgi:hypothetical protein
LAVRDFAESVFPVVAGDSHQVYVLVIHQTAAVSILNRFRKRVMQAQQIDIKKCPSHNSDLFPLATSKYGSVH